MSKPERCQSCDRRYAYVWSAPKALWNRIMGDESGLRCIDCFDALLRDEDMLVRWIPQSIEEEELEI